MKPGGYGTTLVVLLSALFMAQFDFFAVNVAAPSLRSELHASSAALELIVGGYAFTYAAGMITAGRLGDRYGHRRLFAMGMVAFAFTSLLCGIALTSVQLAVARLSQGLAGAVMVPQVLAVITAAFPRELRRRAMGWYGAAAGIGSIAGQVLGGGLLDVNLFGLGWRLIFLINVPIGVAAALFAYRKVPVTRGNTHTRLDPVGAVGVAVTLALLLVPLTLGRTEGWPLWTWVCLIASVPVGAATVRWQRALNSRGGQPVLALSLFRVSSYVVGIVSIVAFMAYFAGFMFTLTLLLQGALGLSAFQAGLVFAPMGVLYGITSLVGPRLVGRYGLTVVMIGGAVTGFGLLLLVALIALGAVGVPAVIAALVFIGSGNGFVLPQLISAALVVVPSREAGIGSAMFTTAQQFASSAGVAVLGSVFFALGGSLAATADYTHAMMWTTVLNAVLMAIVVGLVGHNKRVSREKFGS